MSILSRNKHAKVNPEVDPAVLSAEVSRVVPRFRLDQRVAGTAWARIRVAVLLHTDRPCDTRVNQDALSAAEREAAKSARTKQTLDDRNTVEAALLNSMQAHSLRCLGTAATVRHGRGLAISFQCPTPPKSAPTRPSRTSARRSPT